MIEYGDLEQSAQYLQDRGLRLLRLAYAVAFKAHRGQKRRSGEDYIFHPVAVAKILTELRMDADTVVAGILHDVIEDSDLTVSDLEKMFGPRIAALVDGVSKLDKIEFKSSLEIQAENFRKMLLAMSRDIRVIVIKLADRLHNMRTMSSVSRASQKKKATETIEIYAPIARRLGMHRFSDELQDLGFRFLHPWRYQVLHEYLQHLHQRHQQGMEDVKNHMWNRLKQHKIDVLWVEVREKQVYSVYKKMQDKQCSIHELADMYGVRICVGSTDDCYRTLGIMHLTYRPFPKRFKDYIASPKPNGYQSLHTVLMRPGGFPIELQIRTPVMHQMAEQGIAAHWLYKSGNDLLDEYPQSWLKNLMIMQESTGNSLQFIENVKMDLHGKSVYILTPKGNIIELKQGATALDYAMELSSHLGFHALSARIDQKSVTLDTVLENGQTVFIVTAETPQVTLSWLNMVKTAKAKRRILGYLQEKKTQQYIALGESLLLQHLSGVINREELQAQSAHFQHLAKKFDEESVDALLVKMAQGRLDAAKVAQEWFEFLRKQPVPTQLTPLVITGQEGDVLNYGPCCKPIPGDQIRGLFEMENGLVVHRMHCERLMQTQRQHPVLEMIWKDPFEREFVTTIFVEVINQRGVLGLLAIAIADSKANIDHLHIDILSSEIANVHVDLGVHGKKHYDKVISALRRLSQVIKIVRLGGDDPYSASQS